MKQPKSSFPIVRKGTSKNTAPAGGQRGIGQAQMAGIRSGRKKG